MLQRRAQPFSDGHHGRLRNQVPWSRADRTGDALGSNRAEVPPHRLKIAGHPEAAPSAIVVDVVVLPDVDGILGQQSLWGPSRD